MCMVFLSCIFVPATGQPRQLPLRRANLPQIPRCRDAAGTHTEIQAQQTDIIHAHKRMQRHNTTAQTLKQNISEIQAHQNTRDNRKHCLLSFGIQPCIQRFQKMSKQSAQNLTDGFHGMACFSKCSRIINLKTNQKVKKLSST